jgi:translation elongation factor P/translation initiation factor 5A
MEHEIHAMNVRKNYLIELDGKLYKVLDVKNDKLGGPGPVKNVHIHALSIHDNSKLHRSFHDLDLIRLLKVTRINNVQWICKKDDTEIYALDENGREIIVDATFGVDESNCIFVSYHGHFLGLNSNVIGSWTSL